MPKKWEKWDIVYVSRFPESVVCQYCGGIFIINTSPCEHCRKDNYISNIVKKNRPVLLWIGQENWFESMTFCIPLSSKHIRESKYEEPIYLNNYQFLHTDNSKNVPMRAMITQASRIDGTALRGKALLGKLTDIITRAKITDKLFEWINF